MLVTHSSSGVVAVAPAGRRMIRGYHESVAYRFPAASMVRSLQKPLTVAPAIGVVVGAGQSQLPFSIPVARSNCLIATGPLPLRWLLPASDEQAHSDEWPASTKRPSTETSLFVSSGLTNGAGLVVVVPL